MTRLSSQGYAVLCALNAARAPLPRSRVRVQAKPDYSLPVAALVRRLARPGVSRSVTRASLSRTLRRLWRDRLVELRGGGVTLTQKHEHRQAILAEHEADPVAAYQGYVAWRSRVAALAGKSYSDPYGSVEGFMAAQRRALRQRPQIYVRDVLITDLRALPVNS